VLSLFSSLFVAELDIYVDDGCVIIKSVIGLHGLAGRGNIPEFKS
jgi:hypothetical protein